MTANEPNLKALGRRLIGDWTTEATHSEVPGTVVAGSASVELLEGERFLCFQTMACSLPELTVQAASFCRSSQV